jgi:hypothetical protein
MTAEPWLSAVMSPASETLIAAGLLLDQVNCASTIGFPQQSRATASSCRLVARGITAVSGVTRTEAALGGSLQPTTIHTAVAKTLIDVGTGSIL